ncbi:MAG: inorganic diphosphatase [Alphaproteobacteria bacterium]|nr:inorganic diphosphatase [Alphaproteobacteria bacterium]
MASHPWHDLPNNPDTCDEWFNVIIEIPRGSRVKYELDKPTGMLRVDRVLYSAVMYPANYGFLPRSYCEDGDPLDVLVLGHEPVVPMSIMQARAIGCMRMKDEGDSDDKIIAVHVNDPAVSDFRDISDLPKHTYLEIKRFFEDYKILEGKEVEVEDLLNATQAVDIVRESFRSYRAHESRLRGW